jgi:hypothetical protein
LQRIVSASERNNINKDRGARKKKMFITFTDGEHVCLD